MMRAISATALLLALGCGAAPIDTVTALGPGGAWTETPLDAELSRIACRSSDGCADVCRIRAHVLEAAGGEREVEHRIAPHARVVVTTRADGSLSVRAAIDRGDERLDAMLELPQRGAIDADEAIHALARPGAGSLPSDARVTRTYERMGAGEGAYLLHETGSAVRTARAERHEELGGDVHRGHVAGERYVADTRASIEGRTRTTESVSVRGDGDRTGRSTTEELDGRGRVVRMRRTIDASWAGGDATEERELEYGEGDLPAAITTRSRGRAFQDEIVARSSRATAIERDAQGRATTYRFRAPEGAPEVAPGGGAEDVVVIARDAAGRVVSISDRSRWGTVATVEIVRDAAGRVVRETDVRERDGETETSTLARTLDATGRITRAEATRPSPADPDSPSRGARSSTVATYQYGERCASDVVVPDELDLLPMLDDRVEYVPF